jgi:chemotaxis protein histidine kinase CheA
METDSIDQIQQVPQNQDSQLVQQPMQEPMKEEPIQELMQQPSEVAHPKPSEHQSSAPSSTPQLLQVKLSQAQLLQPQQSQAQQSQAQQSQAQQSQAQQSQAQQSQAHQSQAQLLQQAQLVQVSQQNKLLQATQQMQATHPQIPPEASSTIPKLLAQQLMEKVAEMNSSKQQQQEAVTYLLNHINENKSRTEDEFFVLSVVYDKVYKKYNAISLLVLILSSLVTLVEAFRLCISDFVRNYPETAATIEIISFSLNIITLFTGTIITILSSIIRFKNYRELLEQLKDKQGLLIIYREKYRKKYEKLLNLLAFDCLTKDDIVDIHEKISEYENEIQKINVMEYLRTKDILKYNKYKTYFDVEMHKMFIDKDLAIKKYETESNITLQEIKNNKIGTNTSKFGKIRAYKRFLLKNKKTVEQNNVVSPNII